MLGGSAIATNSRTFPSPKSESPDISREPPSHSSHLLASINLLPASRDLSILDTSYRRRQWQPTAVLLPGESHGWRSLVGYSPRDCKESDMTEQVLCFALSILWHCLSLGLEWKLTLSSPVATAEFSKCAGILSAALSQHHLSGFEIAQLEFHHLHWLCSQWCFLRPTWLHIPGCLALGEWSHHYGYLGHEDVLCTVLLCILVTSS